MHANPEYLANFATVFRVISLGSVLLFAAMATTWAITTNGEHCIISICEWPTRLSSHSRPI
jgi:hypothetical protein